MASRIVRIPAAPARGPGAGRVLDPAGTVLMVAISASVLVGSLFIASLSADPGRARGSDAGMQPRPGPPPTLPAPVRDGPLPLRGEGVVTFGGR